MTGALWDVRRFATVRSTNDWLLAAARSGGASGMVAVADHQDAGRGRLGRHWEAPPGSSLLVSVLLRPVAPPGELYPVTGSVALAAADACAAVAGVTPEVKWPNDLLVGNRKLAGVLAETDPGAPGGRPGSVAVVAGLGCNVNWDGPPGATSLRRCAGHDVDREALLAAYLEALGRRAGTLDDPAGRRAIVDELRSRCVTVGRPVRVSLGGGASAGGAHELVGTAAAIDDVGRLVVEHGGRHTAVAAGDVVHLRPEEAPGVAGGAPRPASGPPPKPG